MEEREIEHELEKKWYTLEEQAQEDMMMMQRGSGADGQQSPTYEESKAGHGENPINSGASTNPFRILNKKDKDQQAVGMSNLDVKRFKYS